MAHHEAILSITDQLVAEAPSDDLELSLRQHRDRERRPTQLAFRLVQFPCAVPGVRFRNHRAGQNGRCEKERADVQQVEIVA